MLMLVACRLPWHSRRFDYSTPVIASRDTRVHHTLQVQLSYLAILRILIWSLSFYNNVETIIVTTSEIDGPLIMRNSFFAVATPPAHSYKITSSALRYPQNNFIYLCGDRLYMYRSNQGFLPIPLNVQFHLSSNLYSWRVQKKYITFNPS